MDARYACRTDPNSGTCGSDVISVCVSDVFSESIKCKRLICLSSAAMTATEY
jgi:hypothetical protein